MATKEKKPTVTTAARRLCRQHNGNASPGWIWWVDLDTGNLVHVAAFWAAEQPPLEDRKRTRLALLRISHGRMTEVEAQRYIDELGEGW